MEKIIIVCLLVAFIPIYDCLTTYIYKCADELEVDNACYLSDSITKDGNSVITRYVGGCPKGKYCNGKGTGFCEYKKEEYRLKKDESCIIGAECISGICTNGKCSILEIGAKCTSSNNCGDFGTCNSQTFQCESVSKLGESCEQRNCLNGLVCGDGHKCVKKFTQDAGKETFFDSHACKSGRSFNIQAESKNICVDVTSSTDECSSKGTCKVIYSDGTKTYEYFETCKSKSDGTKVCPKMPDSEEWKDYVKKYNEKDADLKEEDYLEMEHISYLDDESILEAYIDYEYGITIGDEDCIRDYYISTFVQEGSFSGFSKLLVLLFALLI